MYVRCVDRANLSRTLRLNVALSACVQVRGTVSAEIIAIADMWATFSALAGADPVDHKASTMGGVPPIDSIDVSAVFQARDGKSNRDTVVLSSEAVIKGAFKLVFEGGGGKNKWVGPDWPAFDSNGSVAPSVPGPPCSPCLFHVVNDTREMSNLANDPQYASVRAELNQILNQTVPYQTGDDGSVTPFLRCPRCIEMLRLSRMPKST